MVKGTAAAIARKNDRLAPQANVAMNFIGHAGSVNNHAGLDRTPAPR